MGIAYSHAAGRAPGRENIHDMAQKKRHGASSEEQPVQLFRQKPQRQKQIAQHPERQSRHDIPSVQTRPHPPQLQQPQQHEHHRRHGLEHDRRRIAPLIRAHDEQRLQYRARTDQQNLQHPPPPLSACSFFPLILPCPPRRCQRYVPDRIRTAASPRPRA